MPARVDLANNINEALNVIQRANHALELTVSAALLAAFGTGVVLTTPGEREYERTIGYISCVGDEYEEMISVDYVKITNDGTIIAHGSSENDDDLDIELTDVSEILDWAELARVLLTNSNVAITPIEAFEDEEA